MGQKRGPYGGTAPNAGISDRPDEQSKISVNSVPA